MATTSTHIIRHVNAPRADVYRALLDARAVATWMVPVGMTSHVHGFDAREGGSFRISLTYDEPTGTGKTTAHTDTYHGHFVKLVPNEQVIEAMEFETADPAMRGEMRITFTLTDAGGGTDILAVHDNLPSGLSPTDNETGWQMALDKLAAFVETTQKMPLEIIDLSQEIFSGMPVFPGLPEVEITVHVSHEQWNGMADSDVVTPAVNRLEMGEHTGTHVDAINHMARQYRGQSIDTMPLTMFYTEGICLDLSQKGLRELIEIADLKRALSEVKLEIKPGDTVLLYTDHYRRAYGTADWHRGPGVSVEAARWLGRQKIAAFGVETASPGVIDVSNKEVHHICGELGFTHYENMINLYQLIGRGRFRFIGLPLKIRGGTGSPVRAVAVFGGRSRP